MKHFALALALAAPLPAVAQDMPKADEGPSLMEQGAQMMLRGLMTEMQPALDEMADALDEAKPYLDDIGPQLKELVALMGDIQNYEKPEMLANGDILIRRKIGAPPLPYKPDIAPPGPELPGPNGEIDL